MSIYDHLEFRHLKYIVAVAEQGTFTAAALSVPVAQSALSRQIASIEEIFNIQIFDRARGGTGASLTPAGEALLMFARQLLQTRTEIIEAVQAIHQSTLLPFRLFFSPCRRTSCGHGLPRLPQTISWERNPARRC